MRKKGFFFIGSVKSNQLEMNWTLEHRKSLTKCWMPKYWLEKKRSTTKYFYTLIEEKNNLFTRTYTTQNHIYTCTMFNFFSFSTNDEKTSKIEFVLQIVNEMMDWMWAEKKKLVWLLLQLPNPHKQRKKIGVRFLSPSFGRSRYLK